MCIFAAVPRLADDMAIPCQIMPFEVAQFQKLVSLKLLEPNDWSATLDSTGHCWEIMDFSRSVVFITTVMGCAAVLKVEWPSSINFLGFVHTTNSLQASVDFYLGSIALYSQKIWILPHFVAIATYYPQLMVTLYTQGLVICQLFRS